MDIVIFNYILREVNSCADFLASMISRVRIQIKVLPYELLSLKQKIVSVMSLSIYNYYI